MLFSRSLSFSIIEKYSVQRLSNFSPNLPELLFVPVLCDGGDMYDHLLLVFDNVLYQLLLVLLDIFEHIQNLSEPAHKILTIRYFSVAIPIDDADDCEESVCSTKGSSHEAFRSFRLYSSYGCLYICFYFTPVGDTCL